MSYTNKLGDIIQKLGVDLVGWTHPEFKNPADLPTQLDLLEELWDALKNDTCKFIRLTDVQVRQRVEAMGKAIDEGTALAPRVCKRRKDAGMPRTKAALGNKLPVQSAPDITPPAQPAPNSPLPVNPAPGNIIPVQPVMEPPTLKGNGTTQGMDVEPNEAPPAKKQRRVTLKVTNPTVSGSTAGGPSKATRTRKGGKAKKALSPAEIQDSEKPPAPRYF